MATLFLMKICHFFGDCGKRYRYYFHSTKVQISSASINQIERAADGLKEIHGKEWANLAGVSCTYFGFAVTIRFPYCSTVFCAISRFYSNSLLDLVKVVLETKCSIHGVKIIDSPKR